MCGITATHQLWCWGSNDGGRLGDGTSVDRLVPTRIGTASDWIDPTLRLRGESGPHSWLADEGYNYGPLLTNMSTYINPEKRGNQTATVNIKTIQDFHGNHDIDLGAERVATLYNFGRTKYGNRGVFTGGWERNATTGQYLYPVFRRGAQGTDPSEILQIGPGENPSANGWTAWDAMPNGLGTQAPFLHWVAIRGASAHIERFFDNAGDS